MIITKINDAAAAYVIQKMIQRKIPCIRLDSDEFAANIIELYWESNISPSALLIKHVKG